MPYATKSERTVNAALRLVVSGEREPRAVPRLTLANEAPVDGTQRVGDSARDHAPSVVLDGLDDGRLGRAQVEHAHRHSRRRQDPRGHAATLEAPAQM